MQWCLEAYVPRETLLSRRGDKTALRDFFFLDQPQMPADIQSEVPREEAGDSLDVEGAIGEIRSGVRGTLHDPDLARSAISIVKTAAVIDGRDGVRATVDEEQGSRLE